MRYFLDGKETNIESLKFILDNPKDDEVIELWEIKGNCMYFETHTYGKYY